MLRYIHASTVHERSTNFCTIKLKQHFQLTCFCYTCFCYFCFHIVNWCLLKSLFEIFFWKVSCLYAQTQHNARTYTHTAQTINKYTLLVYAFCLFLCGKTFIKSTPTLRFGIFHGEGSRHLFIEHVCDQIIRIQHGWGTRWLNNKWKFCNLKSQKSSHSRLLFVACFI